MELGLCWNCPELVGKMPGGYADTVTVYRTPKYRDNLPRFRSAETTATRVPLDNRDFRRGGGVAARACGAPEAGRAALRGRRSTPAPPLAGRSSPPVAAGPRSP